MRSMRLTHPHVIGLAIGLLLASIAAAASRDELREQVRATERGFARSMADRDIVAFESFLAPDTVFLSGAKADRGAKEVVAAWRPLFTGPVQFSWEPDKVEVTGSGTLAMSSGPIYDPTGKRIGTFNSVWRRERNGKWKIVLDNGCPACNCSPAPK